MSILETSALGKSYRTYASEFHRFAAWFFPSVVPIEETAIIRDVTLRIDQGESVGIIGQNGAGKSTLLKLLSGIIRPTSGSVSVHGRIAAILELGMGFNPDFTGRQNAYNALGMMGFDHDAITAAIPDVEAFAEIGDYFDRPLRIYSSGMQVRVAFAVATVYRPDILIVDEALSVGDAYFQHKSFARIREFREQGTTLLLVSHDDTAILSICDRAIFLEGGEIVCDGSPETVIDYYKAFIAAREGTQIVQNTLEDGRIQTLSGNFEATVESLGLYDPEGNQIENVEVGERIVLRARIAVHAPISSLVFGYSIKNRLGQVLYGTNTWHTGDRLCDLLPGEYYDISVSFEADLGVGDYSIQTALHADEDHLSQNYEWRDLALIFSVINTRHPYYNGLVWLEPAITIDRKE